jgi:tRNA/tmRNA/rRNA uracil-C5-methylase (TrmA/RlmC/RlmD family)
MWSTIKQTILYDTDVKLYKGRDYILEEMEGLKFSINAKSFYQTNSDQAYELYKITRDFAGLTGNEIVYDLYTGTGTIAQFVSKRQKKVMVSKVFLMPSRTPKPMQCVTILITASSM